MFVLVNFCIAFTLGFIESLAGLQTSSGRGILSTIYQVVVLVPTIALSFRRMHDTNHSAWWLLVPFVNFILTVREGTIGENKYGSDPKSPASSELYFG